MSEMGPRVDGRRMWGQLPVTGDGWYNWVPIALSHSSTTTLNTAMSQLDSSSGEF